MTERLFVAQGKVVDATSQQGIPGLRVEGWDKDQKYNDLLGVAVTDRNGGFKIEFDQSYFREMYPDTSPDLFFKVLRGKTLLKSTEKAVIWNAKTNTEVIIIVEGQTTRSLGKDRLSTKQLLKGSNFLKRSDFRGVGKEVEDRGGMIVKVASDMLKNTFSKMDLKPIKVGDHKTSGIVNQDVNIATQNLRKQDVHVSEVRNYRPGMNKQSLNDLASMPVRLKSGQRVILYQENGKVRYYSIVKDAAPSAEWVNTMSRVDADISGIKSDLQQLKRGGQINADGTSPELEIITLKESLILAGKHSQNEIDSIKRELKKVKQQSIQKDTQIAELKDQVQTLHTLEQQTKTFMEKFVAMEQEIQRLKDR